MWKTIKQLVHSKWSLAAGCGQRETALTNHSHPRVIEGIFKLHFPKKQHKGTNLMGKENTMRYYFTATRKARIV